MRFVQLIKEDKMRTIVRESWAISWPMTLIMLYEFLIGLTDIYVAGKFGKAAQAAYGFSFQLYFVFIIIGIAFSIGVVSVVSRLFTSGKEEKFNHAVNSSVVMSFVLGLVFSVIGVFFSKDIIRIFNLPAELAEKSAPFMVIYSTAFVFDYMLMSTNGVLRACNMVRKSLITMSIVCIMNVVLDFVFAFATPLGLKGIALATVVSLFVGAVINLSYSRKLISRFSFSLPIVKSIFEIGWPSVLLQALWQLGALALFLILSLLPIHNVEIMAAFTNGLKIESAIFLPAVAFNLANAVIVGNLLGKKDGKNAFRGGIVTAIMGMAIVGLMTIMVIFNAHRIARFLSHDETVIRESIRYIYIALIAEPALAWGIILGGGLNGAGDTKGVMKITAISIWIVRIPLCFVLSIICQIGVLAVWWTMNLSIFIQSTLLTVRYCRKGWMALKEV